MKLLEKNVIDVWGDQGKLWLKQLPSLVLKLSRHWNLSDIKPFSNLSYNYVASAITQNKSAVLKICCDPQIFSDEYRALTHFNGQGAIRVLDIYSDFNAFLLEHATPGNSLKMKCLSEISHTIDRYSAVVKKLASHSLPSEPFTHVKKWCDAIDKIHDDQIKPGYILKAKALRDFLLSSAKNEYVCHGDLHLENILRNGNAWLSIDPKGIMGEMAFEAAAFDLIDHTEWSTPELIADKLLNRIHLLANSLNINKNRLLAWVYLRAIISTQWFIEDKGNPSEMLKLIEVIYSYPMHTSFCIPPKSA